MQAHSVPGLEGHRCRFGRVFRFQMRIVDHHQIESIELFVEQLPLRRLSRMTGSHDVSAAIPTAARDPVRSSGHGQIESQLQWFSPPSGILQQGDRHKTAIAPEMGNSISPLDIHTKRFQRVTFFSWRGC